MLKMPRFQGKKTIYPSRSYGHTVHRSLPAPVVDPEKQKVAKAALQQALRDKFVKHHVGMPTGEELIEGNNYVVGKDGLYLVRKNKIGLFITKADKIPFIDDDKNPVEGFHMSLERKLPHNMLLQTIAFFKKVVKEKGNAEAMIQVFLKEGEDGGEYFMHIADQEVSGASVKFKRDPNLEDTHTLVLDIHSHNTMGAFFSGTDNRDEQEARVYGVIGKLNQEWPEMKFRAGNGNGGWIELSAYDVFETPDVAVEFPNEWMEKVHKPGSGVFGEHSKPTPTYPVSPYGSVHDRRVFGGGGWERRPWSTGDYPKVRRFGRAGEIDQDILSEYDWERWEKEIADEDLVEQHVLDLEYELASVQGSSDVRDVAIGINALIESSEVLNKEEARAMWISLVDKLDPISRDELGQVLREMS